MLMKQDLITSYFYGGVDNINILAFHFLGVKNRYKISLCTQNLSLHISIQLWPEGH